MSRRVGNVFIIEPERASQCEECGRVRELRPYGKGGKRICFECATSTPEALAQAEKAFLGRLDGEPEIQS